MVSTAGWMIIGLTAGGLVMAVGALLAESGKPRAPKPSGRDQPAKSAPTEISKKPD